MVNIGVTHSILKLEYYSYILFQIPQHDICHSCSKDRSTNDDVTSSSFSQRKEYWCGIESEEYTNIRTHQAAKQGGRKINSGDLISHGCLTTLTLPRGTEGKTI